MADSTNMAGTNTTPRKPGRRTGSQAGSLADRIVDVAATNPDHWWTPDQLITETTSRWPDTNPDSAERALYRAIQRGELETNQEGRLRAGTAAWAHLESIPDDPDALEEEIAALRNLIDET